MITNASTLTVRASVAVVRGGLIAMALAACAGSAEAQSTQKPTPKPTGTVEVGVGDVSQGSYKAGEYNGLQNKGIFVVGNLDLRGGPSYDGASGLRWRTTVT